MLSSSGSASKKELANKLGVSAATISNWVKTGFIKEPHSPNLYSPEEISKIVKTLEKSPDKLKARANRLLDQGNSICYLGVESSSRQKLLRQSVSLFNRENLPIEVGVFFLAEQILKKSSLLSSTESEPRTPIDHFITNWRKELSIKNEDNIFNHLNYEHIDDDFLGAFYQSINSNSSKSKLGSYYTPKDLLSKITVDKNWRVLDPCCGSGGLLIHLLTKKHDPSKITAFDIDKIALKICKINLSLFFGTKELHFNVGVNDILLPSSPKHTLYDLVISNPPWGGKNQNEGKKIEKHPALQTRETFAIALFHSINFLSNNGTLIFFFPHSILNVSSHKEIRKVLLTQRCDIEIQYLGTPFPGVMSEAILLKLCKKNGSTKTAHHITTFDKENNKSTIPISEILPPFYYISATSSSLDKDIIKKIYSIEHITLANNAKFALGIVTGNNEKHLLNAPDNKTTPIYKGKEINPFRFDLPKHFIHLSPNDYHQIAPLTLYHQKKIVYRFISEKIICALDTENRLLLNSANLFIPTIDYPLETMVILLNSKIYTYLFQKQFHSKKVLRSHIEALPFPLLSNKKHNELKKIYDEKVLNHEVKNENYDNRDDTRLNQTVAEIFQLRELEIKQITES